MTTQSLLSRANSRQLLLRYLQLAEQHPNEEALIFEREPFKGIRRSWGDLVERSEDFKRRLENAGARAHTRCAFVLSDHPDTIPALLALWQLDATAVLI